MIKKTALIILILMLSITTTVMAKNSSENKRHMIRVERIENIQEKDKIDNVLDVEFSSLGSESKAVKTSAKAFNGYMGALNVKDLLESTSKGVNKALDEEQKDDSAVKTWAKATAYACVDFSGIPTIAKTFKKNSKDNNIITATFQTASDLSEALVEEIFKTPSDVGQFLGNLSSKSDLEEADKNYTVMNKKFITFNSKKHKELISLIKDLKQNGYDEKKANERDKLIKYFNNLDDRFDTHPLSENKDMMATLTNRWVESINDEVSFEEKSPETIKNNKQAIVRESKKQLEIQKQSTSSQSSAQTSQRTSNIAAQQAARVALGQSMQQVQPQLQQAVSTYYQATSKADADFKKQQQELKKQYNAIQAQYNRAQSARPAYTTPSQSASSTKVSTNVPIAEDKTLYDPEQYKKSAKDTRKEQIETKLRNMYKQKALLISQLTKEQRKMDETETAKEREYLKGKRIDEQVLGSLSDVSKSVGKLKKGNYFYAEEQGQWPYARYESCIPTAQKIKALYEEIKRFEKENNVRYNYDTGEVIFTGT